MGTFFRLAEDLGLRWKDSLQGEAAPQAKPRQAPKAIIPHSAPQRAIDTTLPPGFAYIGPTLEYQGLPVCWLNPTELAQAVEAAPHLALEILSASTPAVAMLADRFGLELAA